MLHWITAPVKTNDVLTILMKIYKPFVWTSLASTPFGSYKQQRAHTFHGTPTGIEIKNQLKRVDPVYTKWTQERVPDNGDM